MSLTVYLSGEIHTDWRDQIAEGARASTLSLPARSRTMRRATIAGSRSGEEPDKFWHDNKGANVNAIRTRNAIAAADIVVVRFGDKYKQWNAAFDAGYAPLGKSLIVMHGPDHRHAERGRRGSPCGDRDAGAGGAYPALCAGRHASLILRQSGALYLRQAAPCTAWGRFWLQDE